MAITPGAYVAILNENTTFNKTTSGNDWYILPSNNGEYSIETRLKPMTNYTINGTRGSASYKVIFKPELNNYDDKEIFISDSEITSLITAWRSQVGRNPNDDEVARIINDLVQEEILYREALKLGLDQDDRIIKRRLAQKLSFLKQESVEKLPSSQELKDFFNDNKEKYYIEPEYTFTHYFFSSENNSFDRSNNCLLYTSPSPRD